MFDTASKHSTTDTVKPCAEYTWRVPTYQILKPHSRMVVNARNPYHWVANPMVWASDRYPRALLRPIPSWFKKLTHGPAA